MNAAKNGKYSFWVPVSFNKFQIKELVNKTFKVHTVSVSTQKRAGRKFLSLARKKVTVPARKKAVVTLKAKESINIFEAQKK